MGLVLLCGLGAAPLPVGTGQIVMPNASEPLTIYTYKPANYRGGPLIVVFHGVQRNAEDYRNLKDVCVLSE